MYKVAAYANEKEYEHSKEVMVKTLQEEYVVSIKSVTPEKLEIGENILSITMVNDGKYEQEARSGVVLSTTSPYVEVTAGSVGINALDVNQEVTKDFYINVDPAIPNGTKVEFNLNIAQKFAPYREWNHTFTMMYGVDGETGVEEVNDEKNDVEIVYDLQGRRVNNPIKGIYIVNGKKVIYK